MVHTHRTLVDISPILDHRRMSIRTSPTDIITLHPHHCHRTRCHTGVSNHIAHIHRPPLYTLLSQSRQLSSLRQAVVQGLAEATQIGSLQHRPAAVVLAVLAPQRRPQQHQLVPAGPHRLVIHRLPTRHQLLLMRENID